jgi:hypothetical protein
LNGLIERHARGQPRTIGSSNAADRVIVAKHDSQQDHDNREPKDQRGADPPAKRRNICKEWQPAAQHEWNSQAARELLRRRIGTERQNGHEQDEQENQQGAPDIAAFFSLLCRPTGARRNQTKQRSSKPGNHPRPAKPNHVGIARALEHVIDEQYPRDEDQNAEVQEPQPDGIVDVGFIEIGKIHV